MSRMSELMRPKSDHGESDLSAYLENYDRIRPTKACELFLDADKVSIGIWVKDEGVWRRDEVAERKLQQLEFNGDRSVCASIVTRLYGLSPLEYKKMRTSFESELGQSLPGIYVAKYDDQEPEFVLVVELPVKGSAVGLAGAAGIGTAVGLAAGLGGLAMWQRLQTKPPGEKEELQRQNLALQKLLEIERTANWENKWRFGKNPQRFIKAFLNSISNLHGTFDVPFDSMGVYTNPDDTTSKPKYFKDRYKKLSFTGETKDQAKKWESFFDAYITAVALKRDLWANHLPLKISLEEIERIQQKLKKDLSLDTEEGRDALYTLIDRYCHGLWNPKKN